MELRRGDSTTLNLNNIFEELGLEATYNFQEGDVLRFTLRHPTTDAVIVSKTSADGGIDYTVELTGAHVFIASGDWNCVATSRPHYDSPFDFQVTTLAGDVLTLLTDTFDILPDVSR